MKKKKESAETKTEVPGKSVRDVTEEALDQIIVAGSVVYGRDAKMQEVADVARAIRRALLGGHGEVLKRLGRAARKELRTALADPALTPAEEARLQVLLRDRNRVVLTYGNPEGLAPDAIVVDAEGESPNVISAWLAALDKDQLSHGAPQTAEFRRRWRARGRELVAAGISVQALALCLDRMVGTAPFPRVDSPDLTLREPAGRTWTLPDLLERRPRAAAILKELEKDHAQGRIALDMKGRVHPSTEVDVLLRAAMRGAEVPREIVHAFFDDRRKDQERKRKR